MVWESGSALRAGRQLGPNGPRDPAHRDTQLLKQLEPCCGPRWALSRRAGWTRHSLPVGPAPAEPPALAGRHLPGLAPHGLCPSFPQFLFKPEAFHPHSTTPDVPEQRSGFSPPQGRRFPVVLRTSDGSFRLVLILLRPWQGGPRPWAGGGRGCPRGRLLTAL